MDDYICRVIDLPGKVNAVVVLNDGGYCSIYVNAKLSAEEQKKAFDHERRHIEANHLYKKEKPVSECESEAGKKEKKKG